MTRVPSGSDPVRFTADAAGRVAGSVGFTKRLSREAYNRTSIPGVAVGGAAGVSERPQWPVRVTELPSATLGTGEVGAGLYKAKLLQFAYVSGTAAANWADATDVDDCYVAPFDGQAFAVGDHGMASCVGEYAGRGVFALSAGGASEAGFYAKITSGTTTPYSAVEVDGPSASAAAVSGGRTCDANAYEQVTGLAGIPAGTVVWAYPGPPAQPYRFNCVKVDRVVSLAFGTATGETCAIKPVVKTYYVSASHLCGLDALGPAPPALALPTACVEVVTGVAGAIACNASGQPVLTLTLTKAKVRTLTCEACP